MTLIHRIKRLAHRHEWLLCLLAGAIFSITQGQDAFWDLRNYHLYNPWALLHARLTVDLAAASLQGYFNPLLDLPYYLLGTGPLAESPRILAGLQGLWFGGLILVVLKIARRLAGLCERPFGVGDLFAVLIGVTGAMVVAQAGLSSNEMPLAFLILLAVYLLLSVCGTEQCARGTWLILLAGLLSGLAAGLKPTAIAYLPALALALLFAGGTRGLAWRPSMIFCLAATCGFLFAFGWWGWKVYQLTGDPVFPMFNQVFHSHWVPVGTNTDRRYIPDDIWQWIFFPFYWPKLNAGIVTGRQFADARYALAMVSVITLAALALFRRGRARAGRRATRLLVVFVAVSYLAWLYVFSILRYTIPLNALSGLIILLALQALLFGYNRAGRLRRGAGPVMGTLFVILMVFTHYPNWTREPYSNTVFNVQVPSIQPNSLVLVVGQPYAYVIPFMNNTPSSQFVGLTWLNRFADHEGQLGYMTRDSVREHLGGPIYAIMHGEVEKNLKTLRKWIPNAQFAGSCRHITSNLEPHPRHDGTGLRLCRLTQG